MTFRIIAAGALALSSACTTVHAEEVAATAPSDRWTEVKDEIWAKELMIYSGRSRGDLSIYLANTAEGYKAWPPFNEVPKGNDGLKATGAAMAGKTQEKLEMIFLDLALNGDNAIIYYKTHRTMLADGTPVDQRYEVTHTWVLEDGEWKVLGGMARARPAR